MTTKRDPWVRVKSVDEVRSASVLKITRCNGCGVGHLVIFSRPATSKDCGVPCDCGSWGYISAVNCPRAMKYPSDCVCEAIREGRLFRLADDQLTDLSETRELETVR